MEPRNGSDPKRRIQSYAWCFLGLHVDLQESNGVSTSPNHPRVNTCAQQQPNNSGQWPIGSGDQLWAVLFLAQVVGYPWPTRVWVNLKTPSKAADFGPCVHLASILGLPKIFGPRPQRKRAGRPEPKLWPRARPMAWASKANICRRLMESSASNWMRGGGCDLELAKICEKGGGERKKKTWPNWPGAKGGTKPTKSEVLKLIGWSWVWAENPARKGTKETSRATCVFLCGMREEMNGPGFLRPPQETVGERRERTQENCSAKNGMSSSCTGSQTAISKQKTDRTQLIITENRRPRQGTSNATPSSPNWTYCVANRNHVCQSLPGR